MDVRMLGSAEVLRGSVGDVAEEREAHRQRRVFEILVVLVVVAIFLYWRLFTGNYIQPGWPHFSIPEELRQYIPSMILVLLLGVMLILPLAHGGQVARTRSTGRARSRSPLTTSSDSASSRTKSSVRSTCSSRSRRSAIAWVAHRGGRSSSKVHPVPARRTWRRRWRAKPASRSCSCRPSAFQSMYYGQTNRKIRSFFRSLRKIARREGGAIGFIEEIDAIAGSRSGVSRSMADGDSGRGVSRSDSREGISGVVNELLVQMQSFDESTMGGRIRGWFIDRLNRFMPAAHQLRKRRPSGANILVIGATNRAADLDPALLRPGRFDRAVYFGLPGRGGRREIIDYYMKKKAHVPELDKDERRDTLAAMTFGYSPVMIEHLFDEALVWCLRDGREAMEWPDIQQAKLTEEIGLAQPVEYTIEEKATIATHEAGHAVIAYLVGFGLKLEVLSIIKRKDALGLLAHSETEERYTRTRSELIAAIQINFGGMTAEELFFGESGTGPSSDLVNATTLAAQMVGSFGMAGTLLSFEAVQGPFNAGIVAKVLADDEARRSVERILEQAKADVRNLLDSHRHLVIALREQLLEHEELVGDEILEVLQHAEAEQAAAVADA